MGRIAYVNGQFVPHGQAVVHIEDRGYQLADAVYEVWAVFGGKLGDPEGHFARLERSLSELSIPMPMGRAALTLVLKEAVRRNRITEGLLYLQVSRGVAPRQHAYPDAPIRPAVIMTVGRVNRTADEARAAKGVKVVTVPENRWGRADIKTVGLLPNAMAKQKAKEADAMEAWFVDEAKLRHRRRLVQRLDRRRRGPASADPRHQRQYPARRAPATACWTIIAREGNAGRRAALHPG